MLSVYVSNELFLCNQLPLMQLLRTGRESWEDVFIGLHQQKGCCRFAKIGFTGPHMVFPQLDYVKPNACTRRTQQLVTTYTQH